jgi:glyoxylase-like metal-dependent hydrolase (beta-lactamase superfamily II)
LYQPAAHTNGDILVFFRGSDVISTGDLFVTTGYPEIDLKQGGHINGVIEGLNRILDLAISDTFTEGGTRIVPGHGRICDEFEVLEYRDMVTIIRDRVQAMMKKKMTLDQVKAARPTLDYEPRFGSTTGPWTTAMFVDAIYQNLTPPAPKAAAPGARPAPKASGK